jgi:hypothetical protein
VEVNSTDIDEGSEKYRNVSVVKTVLCHRYQEISGTLRQEFPRVLMLENGLYYTMVSQTVLRGKVASAPRKLLNAKFSFLRAIICDF